MRMDRVVLNAVFLFSSAFIFMLAVISILQPKESNPKEYENMEFLGPVTSWTDPTTGCIYYLRNGAIGGMTIKYRSDGSKDCTEKRIKK